ncbi:hypothetical protein IFM89_035936 [Coptis chinensis]|uniref:IST1-like protein n=1 Tax=Coptis chinensis TaxID=261450 RepID=A0A835LCP0_9MAGN|nr:hypothetical protein IFM89_035936 [Coptis chinensis]
MNMFEVLFGWRKASRCKKLIRRVQCRLKLLKNKRDSIVRQVRQDVVQLIKDGHEDCALSRIDQIYKDQSLKAVYDLLDNFCGFIIVNLSYIRKHRLRQSQNIEMVPYVLTTPETMYLILQYLDCPNDINEAVSSLLFASARFGDLPELIKLRKLFGERYGQRFAVTAVELSYGNLVNPQIIENLCTKSIPDHLKLDLMKEIARDNGLELDYPENGIEFELQHRQQSDLLMENGEFEWMEQDLSGVQVTYMSIGGTQLQASNEKELQEFAKSNNSMSRWKKIEESPPSYRCFEMNIGTVGGTTALPSTQDVQEFSSDLIHESSVNMENHDESDTLYEVEMLPERIPCQSNPGRSSSSTLSNATLQHKVEKITRAASESPSCFSERSVVYLDDVMELQPNVKDDKQKDQRLFVFTENNPSVRKDCTEPWEPSDGKTSSRSASKRRKSSKRRLNGRYVLVENLSMKDVECALYYGEPGYTSQDDDLSSLRSYPHRKHQKKTPDLEILTSPVTNHRKKLSSPKSPYFNGWRIREEAHLKEMESHSVSHGCKRNQKNYDDCKFSHDKVGRFLVKPSYLIASDEEDEWESPSRRQRSKSKALKGLSSSNLQGKREDTLHNSHCSPDEAFCKKINTDRKGSRGATDKAMNNCIEEAEVIDCRPSCASSHDSCSRVTSPWMHVRPPYLRAMTMPPERPKELPSNQILKSTSSLPKHQSHSKIGSPSYVHPKLPEYDDLAAKFRALKKETDA